MSAKPADAPASTAQQQAREALATVFNHCTGRTVGTNLASNTLATFINEHPDAPSADAVGEDRESLGKLVRAVWIEWAREQPNPKPSWLVPWEELAEPDREVDRRIGERLHAAAYPALVARIAELEAEVERRFGIGGELIAARRERDEARAECERLRDDPCESGDPACGPATHRDSEGVPLCASCWARL